MKRLHRKDLWCWSVFNERLDIDFNSFVWTRPDGNVVIDPLPMTAHDREHLGKLGGAAWIVLTNRDHVRGARELAAEFGAMIAGPAAERDGFPVACDAWLSEREPLFDWRVFELDGSKTPGELALLIDGTTLVTGDLVRAHRAASLMTLRSATSRWPALWKVRHERADACIHPCTFLQVPWLPFLTRGAPSPSACCPACRPCCRRRAPAMSTTAPTWGARSSVS